MSYTRDWSVSIPIDHTQNKSWPTKIRDVRTDLGERLAAILYGFTAGELSSHIGVKLGRLITIGTAAGTTPPGTGSAASVDVYARANGTATAVELYALDASGNEIKLTSSGKIPLDVSGRLANNAYLIARNAAGDGNVNILKVNTANAIELPTHIIAPDTNPTTALQYAPKGYADKVDHGGLSGLTDNDHTLYVRGQDVNYKIDSGTISAPSGNTSITFNFAFASAPTVVVSFVINEDGYTTPIYVKSVTTAGCVVRQTNGGNAPTAHWIAIGTPA